MNVGREHVLDQIRTVLPELKAMGVTDLHLFGSHARGDANQDSDVDVLVSLPAHDYSLYCRVLDVLENALGKRVDLVMVEALKPDYREQVLQEAVRVA